MPWIPGVPIASGNIHGYRTCRPAAVAHRTYGSWAGDYSVIQNEGLAHILVGKYEGQWAQFGPTEALFYHCNGANDAYGIEITGINEDPFTDWQIRCMRYILPQVAALTGMPMTYDDQAWINGHAFYGVHSHNGILTDDGTWQHTNLWLRSDWNRLVENTSNSGSKKEEDKVRYIKCSALGVPGSYGIYATNDISKRLITPTEWKFVNDLASLFGGGAPAVQDVPLDWFNSIPVAK